jgi:DNA-binding NarL/FixJ family response regulator
VRCTRVLLVDDHDRVRAGVRALLRPLSDLEVVGEAVDGDQAVVLAQRLKPDVVLMDVSMPSMDGIEATRRIRALDPSIRVIVVTASCGREREAYGAGAAGHVLKDARPDELISSLRHAHA